MDFIFNGLHWIQSLGFLQWIQSLSWVATIILFSTFLTLSLGVSSYFIFKLNNRVAQKELANSSAQFYRRIYFDCSDGELIDDREFVEDEDFIDVGEEIVEK